MPPAGTVTDGDENETESSSAENPLFKEIVESQLAFAKRATQWEQDTVVSRKLVFDHYFGAQAKPVRL